MTCVPSSSRRFVVAVKLQIDGAGVFSASSEISIAAANGAAEGDDMLRFPLRAALPVIMCGLFAICASARANTINFVAALTSGTGPTTWNYSFSISADSEVRSGDKIVVVDFNQYVPGSIVAPLGWSADGTQANVSSISSDLGTSTVGTANPGIADLIWTYTGSTTIGPGLITGFTAKSGSSIHIGGEGLAVDHVTTGASAGKTQSNNMAPDVPAVPLPATANMGLVLLGSIGGLGALRRLKNSKTVEA